MPSALYPHHPPLPPSCKYAAAGKASFFQNDVASECNLANKYVSNETHMLLQQREFPGGKLRVLHTYHCLSWKDLQWISSEEDTKHILLLSILYLYTSINSIFMEWWAMSFFPPTCDWWDYRRLFMYSKLIIISAVPMVMDLLKKAQASGVWRSRGGDQQLFNGASWDSWWLFVYV